MEAKEGNMGMGQPNAVGRLTVNVDVGGLVVFQRNADIDCVLVLLPCVCRHEGRHDAIVVGWGREEQGKGDDYKA